MDLPDVIEPGAVVTDRDGSTPAAIEADAARPAVAVGQPEAAVMDQDARGARPEPGLGSFGRPDDDPPLEAGPRRRPDRAAQLAEVAGCGTRSRTNIGITREVFDGYSPNSGSSAT